MNVFEKRKPENLHYAIPREKFEGMLAEWFKEAHDIEAYFNSSWEGPDDDGYLGSYYFRFDFEKMTQDHTEKIAETYFWIEDLEYDLHLDIILEEIYGKGTRHDFDPIEEEVYIFVPYK